MQADVACVPWMSIHNNHSKDSVQSYQWQTIPAQSQQETTAQHIIVLYYLNNVSVRWQNSQQQLSSIKNSTKLRMLHAYNHLHHHFQALPGLASGPQRSCVVIIPMFGCRKLVESVPLWRTSNYARVGSLWSLGTSQCILTHKGWGFPVALYRV